MSDLSEKPVTILCLCQEDNHRKLLPAYAARFRAQGMQFVCVSWSPPFDSSLREILSASPVKPDYIFHFESDFPLLPIGLEKSDVPTVCFQVDSYAFAKRRIKWSSLFDYVAVFHPGHEVEYARDGHKGTFLLPHAVQKELFEGSEIGREFEIGWVGQIQGPLYKNRAKWIPQLAQMFQMNDIARNYSLREVADVYRRSRIVVNFGRDDYPQDANMRVFEVLASGALLITAQPTELAALGFAEGVHFAAYQSESELVPLIRRFLADEPLRLRISRAARSKVLREHTYDCRVKQIMQKLNQGPERLAPARNWEEPAIRLSYLDYFAAHGILDAAKSQFKQLDSGAIRERLEGMAVLAKARLAKALVRRNK